MIIAKGSSRKARVWKNIDVSWEKLESIFSKTRRTVETVEEYKTLSKELQDNIKDVGGFVGGQLREGKRRNGFVECRTLLTLDMDYGEKNSWEIVKANFQYTCCIYSTHKYTSEKPRLRLIIPLSRPVSPDEYVAVGRKVASLIGIEMFDDTTYEPARLMYWPSTSSDGEFIFKNQKTMMLDPEHILSTYENWRDASQWPVSSRQQQIVQKNSSQQGDPLKKDGLVGAFCTAYTMEEAIDKFLPKIYSPSAISGRYNYISADSTAGLVLYDNKFAYSHHATDPVCGKRLNAFDLVRLHRFGKLDEKVSRSTLMVNLPSFQAMQDLCREDKGVKRDLISKLEGGNRDFNDGEYNWRDELVFDKDGKLKDTLGNIVLIIRNDEKLKDIAYNLHRDSVDVKGEVPWLQAKSGWNDADMSALKVYCDSAYGVWSPAKLKEAIIAVSVERAYHPIRDYFHELKPWDGVKRVDELLINYLGAEDNVYTRAVTRKTLVAAVARVFQPGVKFDCVLTTYGGQGAGKSTLFEKLGLRWFSDSLSIADMKDKSAPEKLQGSWIVEIGELAGMRKMEIETIKAFISRRDDKFRCSYGTNVESHPRQCIMVATTNNDGGFLRDITGNRRFWPVRVLGSTTKKSWHLTTEDIDEIWAEAYEIYQQGEELFLSGEEERIAVAEQTEAMESDEREGLIREYLDLLLPENWDDISIYDRRNFVNGTENGIETMGTVKRNLVSIIEIWCECFGKEKADLKPKDSREISAMLVKIGWQPYDGNKNHTKTVKVYGKQRCMMRRE